MPALPDNSPQVWPSSSTLPSIPTSSWDSTNTLSYHWWVQWLVIWLSLSWREGMRRRRRIRRWKTLFSGTVFSDYFSLWTGYGVSFPPLDLTPLSFSYHELSWWVNKQAKRPFVPILYSGGTHQLAPLFKLGKKGLLASVFNQQLSTQWSQVRRWGAYPIVCLLRKFFRYLQTGNIFLSSICILVV